MTQKDLEERQANWAGVDDRLARHGGLSYLEIPALDGQRSAIFYKLVLGWNVSGEDSGRPKFSDQTGHLIGRWVTGRAIFRDPGLVPFIYVDSVDKVLARVVAHGGEIVNAARPEGNLRVATFRDPAGNLFGLWQAAK